MGNECQIISMWGKIIPYNTLKKFLNSELSKDSKSYHFTQSEYVKTKDTFGSINSFMEKLNDLNITIEDLDSISKKLSKIYFRYNLALVSNNEKNIEEIDNETTKLLEDNNLLQLISNYMKKPMNNNKNYVSMITYMINIIFAINIYYKDEYIKIYNSKSRNEKLLLLEEQVNSIKQQIMELELYLEAIKNDIVNVQQINNSENGKLNGCRTENKYNELCKYTKVNEDIEKLYHILSTCKIVDTNDIPKHYIGIGSNFEISNQIGEDKLNTSIVLVQKRFSNDPDNFVSLDSELGKQAYGKTLGEKINIELGNETIKYIITGLEKGKEKTI